MFGKLLKHKFCTHANIFLIRNKVIPCSDSGTGQLRLKWQVLKVKTKEVFCHPQKPQTCLRKIRDVS